MPQKILIFDKNKVKPGSLSDLKKNLPIWLDYEKPSDKDLVEVNNLVDFEIQELREWLRSSQRPTLVNLKNFTAIIVSMVVEKEGLKQTGSLVVFMAKNRKTLITLHKRPAEAVQKILKYEDSRLGKLFGNGLDKLLFSLLEEIIDGYFSASDYLSDQIEEIEKKMFDFKHSNAVMKSTFGVKKSLIFFHKALVANREVVASIEKHYAQYLDRQQSYFFGDLTADMAQLIELVTTYRDIITSAIEIHLTSVSNNLNVIMKKVTSWGALILVPSLIAGIFGMNFSHIPTLDHPAGFFIALVLMVVSVSVLAWYFKKQDWL